MRINKYIALATGVGRRQADKVIGEGKVLINGQAPKLGQDITNTDSVTISGNKLQLPDTTTTIMMNKPVGYVCSRDGQGSQTIYDLLPEQYKSLKSIGRLDKNSSGLILLTNDGELANQLTHPSNKKQKVYEIKLSKPLYDGDKRAISVQGIRLEDGISKLQLEGLDGAGDKWRVTMHEGRNRQIRRTFEAKGYRVIDLRRTQFGEYDLSQIAPTQVFTLINT